MRGDKDKYWNKYESNVLDRNLLTTINPEKYGLKKEIEIQYLFIYLSTIIQQRRNKIDHIHKGRWHTQEK